MELELQEWLFLILGLVIVVVLVHGFWVQYFGSDRLPLKLDKRFVSTAPESNAGKDVIDLKAELPNGGARVVKVGTSQIPVSDPAQARVRQSAAKTPRDDPAGSTEAASRGAHDEALMMKALTMKALRRTSARPMRQRRRKRRAVPQTRAP